MLGWSTTRYETIAHADSINTGPQDVLHVIIKLSNIVQQVVLLHSSQFETKKEM